MLALAAAVLPASVGAATARVEDDESLVYEAGAGEANMVSGVRESLGPPATYTIRDPGAVITSGAGCVSVGPHAVTCRANGGHVSVRLGDLDDRASFKASCCLSEQTDDSLLVLVEGGEGDDTLEAGTPPGVLAGGPGNDTLLRRVGGREEVWIRGGAGRDRLIGGPGREVLEGGLGPDLMRGGTHPTGAVRWRVADSMTEYSERRKPVFVRLDGLANDGAKGEGDNVMGDIELMGGGRAGDTFIGDAGSNTFVGGPSADVIIGKGGEDVLEGWSGHDRIDGGAGADHLSGGGGRDMIRGGAGADSIFGGVEAEAHASPEAFPHFQGPAHNDAIWAGAGNDLVWGLGGDDVIHGGPGVDGLRGGPGRDSFFARDRTRDRISGLFGLDRACVDRGLDRVRTVEIIDTGRCLFRPRLAGRLPSATG